MAFSLPLTIQDTHRQIEEDVQRLGFYVYDNLESEQIDLQINRQIYYAIDGILDKYFGRKLKIGIDQGFQVDQVSLDNLRQQHVKDANTTLTTSTGIGKKFELPADYYHYIKAKATISYSCYEDGVKKTKTEPVKVRIVKSQDIDNMLNHPFHKTVKESPIGEIAGNYVYIYTNSDFDVTEVKLDYIKKPVKVVFAKDISGNYDAANSVHFDIDNSLQYMIIDMTVLKIIKIIESPQQKIINLEQETN